MGVYVEDIVIGVVLFPLVAALLTLPYAVVQYRRYGLVPWMHTMGFYAFALYLLCTLCLVTMPLPSDPSALDAGRETMRLKPFSFLWDIARQGGKAYAATGSALSVLAVPAFYGVVFNVLLTVPLGVFLRCFFHCSWWQTLLLGLACTLFFELTQLTGDWGLYPVPYRLFDVDDLIANTTGAMLGYALGGPLDKLLPDLRAVRHELGDRALRASATRRGLSFLLDLGLSALAWAVLALALKEADPTGGLLDSASFKLLVASQLVFLCVVPALTGGQTLGQRVFKLRIVRPDASPVRRWQPVVRYGLILAIFYLPQIFIFTAVALDHSMELAGMSAADEAVAVTFVASNFVLLSLAWMGLLALWALSLVVQAVVARLLKRPFVMLNGLLSGTRVMTEEGIEAARNRGEVMSVADVVALERSLDASGTSLASLMESAGRSVAEAVARHFYSTLDGRGRKANARRSVVVLAGTGNNGGDGWVAARHLAQAGYPVALVTPRPADELRAQPARDAALELMEQLPGLPILRVLVAPSATQLESELACAAVVIDALLGTGFGGGQMREPAASWVRAANARRAQGTRRKPAPFALAVDVPSGMSAQDGTVGEPCFEADLTLTMLAIKPGLVLEQSAPYVGALRLSPLVSLA
ncbi:MAG: NAD(P)H-hydrate epimerase [Coriobacteriales bacterium]